jgi:hypothetical protein
MWSVGKVEPTFAGTDSRDMMAMIDQTKLDTMFSRYGTNGTITEAQIDSALAQPMQDLSRQMMEGLKQSFSAVAAGKTSIDQADIDNYVKQNPLSTDDKTLAHNVFGSLYVQNPTHVGIAQPS